MSDFAIKARPLDKLNEVVSPETLATRQREVQAEKATLQTAFDREQKAAAAYAAMQTLKTLDDAAPQGLSGYLEAHLDQLRDRAAALEGQVKQTAAARTANAARGAVLGDLDSMQQDIRKLTESTALAVESPYAFQNYALSVIGRIESFRGAGLEDVQGLSHVDKNALAAVANEVRRFALQVETQALPSVQSPHFQQQSVAHIVENAATLGDFAALDALPRRMAELSYADSSEVLRKIQDTLLRELGAKADPSRLNAISGVLEAEPQSPAGRMAAQLLNGATGYDGVKLEALGLSEAATAAMRQEHALSYMTGLGHEMKPERADDVLAALTAWPRPDAIKEAANAFANSYHRFETPEERAPFAPLARFLLAHLPVPGDELSAERERRGYEQLQQIVAG